MNIGIYAGSLYNNRNDLARNLAVATISFISKQNSAHRFFIFSDDPAEKLIHGLPGIEIIKTGALKKNLVQKHYWWDIKLPAALKRIKADVLISFNGHCSSRTSVPQIVLITGVDAIKKEQLKKAASLLVIPEELKEKLANEFGIDSGKIKLIDPVASAAFKPVDQAKKGTIKEKNTCGKEFFLYNGSLTRKEDIMRVLKAFSKFKKRMQSNLQLAFLNDHTGSFLNILENYKYRDDVKFIAPEDEETAAMITASAYAVVLINTNSSNILATLEAMKCGVPVINFNDGAKKILTTVNGDSSDDAEKMIRLYADEKYRDELVAEGMKKTAGSIPERTGEQVWQVVLKTVG